jgi:hypothetical protein
MPPINGPTKFIKAQRCYKHLVPTGRKQLRPQSMCFMLELTQLALPRGRASDTLLNPRDAIPGFRKLHEHRRVMSRHDQIGTRGDLLHAILGFEI